MRRLTAAASGSRLIRSGVGPVAVVLVLVGCPLSAASSGSPSAFPSEGLLVFGCACPEGGEALWTIRPDGTELRVLAAGGPSSALSPRWSPDGRTIAYVRDSRTISLVRADGTGERALTRRGFTETPASWSPRGKRLVYARGPTSEYDDGVRTSLHTIRANGSRPQVLVRPPASSPDWSPDGRRIAFNDPKRRMWVANADGSKRRRLGPTRLRGTEPQWSPDGRRVAYVDSVPFTPRPGRIRVLDLPTGRVQTLLTFDPLFNARAHTWSPDGRWLALMRGVPLDPDECGFPQSDDCYSLELWILNASDERRAMVWSTLLGYVIGIDWRR